MKILKPQQVVQLINILSKNPQHHVIHFSKSSHLLTKKLHKFCQEIDAQYHLYCTKDVFYDKSTTKYKNKSHILIEKFNVEMTFSNLIGHNYHTLILTLDVNFKTEIAFLKQCHPLIRPEGMLIIITPKSEETMLNRWKTILKEPFYISVKFVGDLFDTYDVIIAKKG